VEIYHFEITKNYMDKILKYVLIVAAVLVAVWIGIGIYHSVKGKSYNEKRLECTKAGSNQREADCLRWIN
jgi:hypothetical protein